MTTERTTAVFAAVGVLLRLVRYLTDRPLWGDEAMIAVNVLGRGFGGLIGPLDFFQVAPVGFLWSERGLVGLLGPSSWSLRLLPACCAAASVPLFVGLARSLLGRRAALLAVAVFAVSASPIRHGAEIKPYAVDLLAATALMLAAVRWQRAPECRWRFRLLLTLVPAALAISHPAVFVAGGIGLVMLVATFRGQGPSRVRVAGYLAVVVSSFAAWYVLSTQRQAEAVGDAYRHGYWADAFPPLGDPLGLVRWLAATHTGEAFGYPIGGQAGGSVLSTALVAAGIVGLWRRHRGLTLGLTLAPIALTLAASALGRYPYGTSARTMQHLAPTICLLIGAGASVAIARSRNPSRRKRLSRAILGALLVIGAVQMGLDVARPFRTAEDQRSRDFAHWFWREQALEGEVACLRALGGDTYAGDYWRRGRWELYLAHRDLNLPPEVDPARPRFDRVSDDRPLRCVAFNEPDDLDPNLRATLGDLGTRFRLRDVQTYEVNAGVVDDGMPRVERYRVFAFVPRLDAATPADR